MKSILDSSFKYTPSVATDIRARFLANGAEFREINGSREMNYSELERLRRFRRQVEASVTFSNDEAVFIQSEFEQMLAQADGFERD